MDFLKIMMDSMAKIMKRLQKNQDKGYYNWYQCQENACSSHGTTALTLIEARAERIAKVVEAVCAALKTLPPQDRKIILNGIMKALEKLDD